MPNNIYLCTILPGNYFGWDGRGGMGAGGHKYRFVNTPSCLSWPTPTSISQPHTDRGKYMLVHICNVDSLA